ncbi:MAG: tetratricopeptide repeat protein [Stagnimonas sp.]|nr:tetratricopeptide repeat protein [Stagnimonas sp.]
MASEAPEGNGGNLSWQFAGRSLDERSLELRVHGVRVETEPKPLQLLLFLLRHAGEVVTKDELLENVWPGRIPSESVLSKTMAKLRQLLGDEEQLLIRTAYGHGYQFVAEVQCEHRHGAAPIARLKAGDHPPGRPNWVLSEQLQGGRGEVWKVRQTRSGEDRVFKFAHDAEGLRGLKREITLFRLLKDSFGERRDLPHLLDWNLDTAPWFVEMEYAAGGSLPAWIAAQGGFDAVPLAQRLAFVAEAAEALACAHQAGVLHKDLKPGNLLVVPDAAGAPHIQLADFGSGGVLDGDQLSALNITRLGFTQTLSASEATSGTPLYLAPEVVAGQPPTVRSDLYALGVILYQLLVGDLRRPLAPGWERGVEDELLRADIAACADLQPARRLADAQTLADRLRSLDRRRAEHAARQRREAEDAQLRARLQRIRARRPWLAALSLVLVAGICSTAWLYLQARRAGEAALASARAAQADKKVAQAVNRFLVDDLLAAANPLNSGRKDVPVQEVLAQAAKRVGARFPEQPELEAAVRLAIGKAYVGLAQYPEAGAQFDAALAKAPPGSLDEVRLARVWLYLSQDDQAQAQAALAAYVPDADAPKNHLLGRETALAWLRFRKGDYDGAIQALEALRGRYESELGPDSPDTADLLERLGEAYWTAGRMEPAITVFRDVLERLRRLYGPADARSINAMQGLGAALRLIDRNEESLRVLEPAYALARQTLGEGHDLTLNAEAELGGVYQWLKRYDEAEQHMGHALELRLARYGEDHLISRILLNNMAGLVKERGDPRRALPLFERVYAIEKRLNGEGHPDTLTEAHHIGLTLAALGEWQRAEVLQRRTLELAHKAYPADHWSLGVMSYALADSLAHRGSPEQAAALFEQSVTLLRKTLGEDHRWTRQAVELQTAFLKTSAVRR